MSLTRKRTTVPEIAMSFSDERFPYGPFVPHHVPLDYLQDYYSVHQMEHLLVLNTTVEDLSRISDGTGQDRWQLTLRKYNHAEGLDEWRQEIFDAVIIANGQHSIPYVCVPCRYDSLSLTKLGTSGEGA